MSNFVFCIRALLHDHLKIYLKFEIINQVATVTNSYADRAGNIVTARIRDDIDKISPSIEVKKKRRRDSWKHYISGM